MEVASLLCCLHYHGIYHTTAAVVKEFLPLTMLEMSLLISPSASMEYKDSSVQLEQA